MRDRQTDRERVRQRETERERRNAALAINNSKCAQRYTIRDSMIKSIIRLMNLK